MSTNRLSTPTGRSISSRFRAPGPAPIFFVLWFVATWYFWGDLGKWMDDWNFNMRDPVTGGFAWSDVLALDHWRTNFWRPLHIRFASGLQTVLWNHDWAIHLILAAIHAVNAWVLWKVLARMCGSRQAAAMGALLFLVYPTGHEAIFWMSTLGTGAGLLFFLLCTLAVQRFAAGEVGRKTLVLHLPLLIMAGWWYEQPAACGPALALAYLAAAPVTVPFRKRLVRAVGFGAAAFVAGALYAVLFVGLASASQRGGVGTIVKADQVVPQANLILDQAWHYATMSRFAPAALQEGWRAFWSRLPQATIVVTLFVISLLFFGSWWMRAGRGRVGASAPVGSAGLNKLSLFQRLCAFSFGLAIIAASMVPAMAVNNQWFVSRLAYIPAMGLVLCFAILADSLLGREFALSRSPCGRLARAAALAALVPGLVLGSLMLVGVQSVWHKRSLADKKLARQLRELVPNPPADALLLPVAVRDRIVESKSPWFASPHIGPFEAFWSADAFVKFTYRRKDVHSLGFSRWLDNARAIERLIGAGPDGLVIFGGQFPSSGFARDSKGRLVVPWDKVVPFRVTRPGRVTLASMIRIESLQNPAYDREMPVTSIRVPRGVGDRPGVLPALADEDAVVAELAWVPQAASELNGAPASALESGSSPKPAWAAGRMLSCFTLHPAVPGIPTYSAITTVLEPSPTPRRLAWRVSAMDYLWRGKVRLTDGVGLSVWLGEADKPLTRELITPDRLRAARDWIPIVVDIPPLARPTKIRIRIDPGPATDASCDWCLLTPPVLAPVASVGAPAAATADSDTTPPSEPARP